MGKSKEGALLFDEMTLLQSTTTKKQQQEPEVEKFLEGVADEIGNSKTD